MIRDYAPKGVKFYYIYKALAHPETNGYVTPFTIEERLKHVQEARRTIPTQATWLCDTMGNDVKHALGNAPNSEFVIDPEGVIVSRRSWSSPSELRQDLATLVGAVEKPTRVEELDVRFTPPPAVAAKGVVPRLELPGDLRPLRIEPLIEEGGQPFYVKLRAEATPALLSDGKGKLYLGFHLDPIYRVHWNNLVQAISFELTESEGVSLAPSKGAGPKVTEAADIDPREFLIDVVTDRFDEPLKLTVRYFACSDEEGWCKAIAQEYLIILRDDRDGGRVQRGRPGALAGAGGQQPVPGRLLRVDLTTRLITVRLDGITERAFYVTPDARLRIAGREATLDDLRVDGPVMLGIASGQEEGGHPVVSRLMQPAPGQPLPAGRRPDAGGGLRARPLQPPRPGDLPQG